EADAARGRSAAAVLSLDVAFQLAERVVAAEAQPPDRAISGLEVEAAVAAVQQGVLVLDDPQVEALSELVLDLAGRGVEGGRVEVAELAVDPVHPECAGAADAAGGAEGDLGGGRRTRRRRRCWRWPRRNGHTSR